MIRQIRNYIIIAVVALSTLLFWAFKDDNFAIAKNLDIFYSLFREMNMIYVDETDPEQMVKTAIDAMLQKLDPYTVYIPESQMEDFKFMTTGQYGGIGAMIRKDGEYVVITEPYENFPAAKAGLRAGDLVKMIDNIDVKGKSTEDMSELLKGEPGSQVSLTIQRPGTEQEQIIRVTREKISIDAVPYYGMLNDSVGYFLLSSFTQSASKEVKEAAHILHQQGAKSMVFDLRGNPGGLLIESVNIVNLFVEKGNEVVATKGRVSQWDKTYITKNAAAFPDVPMVILVNSGSASASEIVSGAMQDLDRAVIVGTRTFGKGLVQATRPLSYNSQLKVTTAKYYIPSGRCIQALDYSHRNEDGSVGKVPDSLITEYRTANNRIVYDGGGILPDIKEEPETMSNIAYSLVAQNHIFDYATQYCLKHDSIAPARDYRFADYDDFKTWIANRDLSCESYCAHKLDELIEIAKEENYYEHSQATFDRLKADLANDQNKDLETFKSQIIKLIEQEIVGRYYFQKGAIQNMVAKDKAVQKALEILSDSHRYQSILVGQSEEGQIKKAIE
ncbi:MAG: S41 family peptidase [Bacteroidales bacterium]|nr:S41 family peptidase [Bacteroidales bacterium]